MQGGRSVGVQIWNKNYSRQDVSKSPDQSRYTILLFPVTMGVYEYNFLMIIDWRYTYHLWQKIP